MSRFLSQPSVLTVRSSLRDAWRFGRSWFAAIVALQLALALLPAIQVILLATILSAFPAVSVVLPSMLALAAVVGLAFPLGQCATAAAQRLSLRVRAAYQMLALEYIAGAEPAEIADPRTIETVQSAHEAASGADAVAGDLVRLLCAVLTALSLGASVGVLNPVAGTLVLSSLVPTVWVFTRIAAAEEKGWPLVGTASRRAQYASEQLLQQRTGTELAMLGSSWKVLHQARRWQNESVRVLDRLIAVAMRWELVSGLLTALLLSGALLSLLLVEPDPGAIAASLIGVISGLHATRNVGYAAGAIVTAIPRMAVIDACRTRDAVGAQPIVQQVHEIRARGITVRHVGATSDAVSRVSLMASRGEMIAIVGANGAGKTTLVNALLGVVPSDGEVCVDGEDISNRPTVERLGYFGALSQEFGRYEFTVRDVVGLGRHGSASDEEVRRAVRDARAQGIVDQLPHGLDTQLGQQWHGVGLSGGQWQRLALARIHLRSAGIWILDEPTSAIDAETEEAIFSDLRETKSERITVVVSHRAWTLREMDRIYVMDRGRIVQVGRYDELLRTPGRFAEMFAMQMRCT